MSAACFVKKGLNNMADSGTGHSRSLARGLLLLNGYSLTYKEPTYIPDLDSSGKRSLDQREEITDSPESEETFEMFPNPTDDYVLIKWSWQDLDLDAGFEIAIYDIQGTLVFKKQIENIHLNLYRISTDNWAPGSYVVSITGKKQNRLTETLVVF